MPSQLYSMAKGAEELTYHSCNIAATILGLKRYPTFTFRLVSTLCGCLGIVQYDKLMSLMV